MESVLVVRRSIHIAGPPERVWHEFTSFERMQRWFGIGHRLLTYEARDGGWVELEVDLEGVPTRYGGRIVTFDPPRELTFADDWNPNRGLGRADLHHIPPSLPPSAAPWSS